MKNDPSMLGVSEHERRDRDFYPTPPSATLALFDSEIFKYTEAMTVWEPACGDGAMAKVLETKFNEVVCTDIHPLMEARTADFYTFEPDFEFDAIVTNPPYGKEADKFIERILHFVETKECYGAILARNELDAAKGRAKYFRDCPYFYEKRVLLWRPRWIADTTGSPRHNYAWYIFGPANSNARRLNSASITYSFEKKPPA